MPSVPSFAPSTDSLPHGLNRADGLGGRLGTPTPAAAVKYDTPLGKNSTPTIEELPNSPTMERAEQCTIRHSFTGPYQEMLNRWVVYPRGTLVVDSGGNFFVVLNTTLTPMKPDLAQLDITCEAMSFDCPPDEFQCNTVDLGLDLIKNPRYFYALLPTSQIPPEMLPNGLALDTQYQESVKSVIVRAIQAYRENPLVPPGQVFNSTTGYYHDLISNMVHPTVGQLNVPVKNPNFRPQFRSTQDAKIYPVNGIGWPAAATSDGQPNSPIIYTYHDPKAGLDPNNKILMALAAANELVAKVWRNEDTPPIYGIELSWSEYYWRPPYLNLGGYIEDPMKEAAPQLPDYFTCPKVIPDGTTIFDAIGYFNPQDYSPTGYAGGGVNISWLRQADTLEFQRTFFKVTRRWIGAPVGCWDGDLFKGNKKASDHRPSVYTDYKYLNFS